MVRMLGSVRGLFAQYHPGDIYNRAVAGDREFFAAQHAPLAAFAAIEQGVPVILLSQLQPVRELDADHAVIVPGEQGPRVFATEVGTSAMTGAPTHFFCELDPFTQGTGRKGNFGNIDVPSGDALAILRALAGKAFQIIYTRAQAPAAPPDPFARATEAMKRGDMKGAGTELERSAQGLEATNPPVAAMVYCELASLRRDLGDPRRAIAACDRALALVAPGQSHPALTTRAAALDDLEDAGAIAAWGEAARWAPSPDGRLVCEAHAVGATTRHDPRQSALPGQFVTNLGRPPPMTLASVLGAIGTSLGKQGTGYLAQVAWLVFAVDGLFTVPNVALIDLLATRVGLKTDDGFQICSLLLLRLLANDGKQPVDPDAPARAIAIVDRVAKARGIARDALIRVLAADDNPHIKVDHALRTLAARTPWLIPTG